MEVIIYLLILYPQTNAFYRTLQKTPQCLLRIYDPRKCLICVSLPGKFPIPPLDRSDSNRCRIHLLPVHQTILFGLTHRRYPSTNNTCRLACYRPRIRFLRWSLHRRSSLQNRFRKQGIQRNDKPWLVFGCILSSQIFKDVPIRPRGEVYELSNQTENESQSPAVERQPVTRQQWGVIICMCYYAMTCFLILGSWEANIPVFTAQALGYSPYQAGNFIALGGIASFPFLILNVRYARLIQDRIVLASGTTLGLIGLAIMLAILHTDKVHFGSLLVCWFLIALGFNLASTCGLSLLSKQLPDTWNSRMSMAIQYSNYVGRVTGAILGGAGVRMGMMNYVGVQIAIVGIGGLMYLTLWRQLKAKTG
jgi:Major Facilitator Superfamily